MMNILIDTNIILDIALKRKPFFADAVTIFELFDEESYNGFFSATTATDIYYVTRKANNKQSAKDFLLDLLKLLDVIGVERTIIESALKSGISDFEDAVQVKAAESSAIDVIVTRNKKDFDGSKIPVYEPKELIKFLSKK